MMCERRDKLIADYLKDKPFLMFKDSKGCFKYKFIDPGAGYDSNLWDWDSYFSIKGLFEICEYFKDDQSFNYNLKFKQTVEHSKGCVLNFLDLQTEDGFIPMASTSDGWYAKDLYLAHDKGESVNQHKPFLSQNILNISKKIDDYKWFDIEKVLKYIDYFDNNQYDRESGLYFWQDDVMIGIDNNPTVFGRPERSCADIYLNCFMYAELDAVYELLIKLNDSRAEIYRKRKDSLKDAVNENMYDEKDCIYYSQDLLSKTRMKGIYHKNLGVLWKSMPLKIRIWACLLPMLVGISSQEINKKMVEKHFYDKDFICEYGVRTLSKNEKMYDERPSGNPSNWLGSIWIIANYCVWRGLKNNGFINEANDIKEKTLNLIYNDIKDNGNMSESYNSITGKPILHGGFISWNCLVVEMLF